MNKDIKKITKDILNKIKEHKTIVIFHHVNPDGDCLGSQQGLKLWIEKNFPDKKVYAVGSNKDLFKFLDFKFDEIPSEEILKESLGIVVDANYSNRIVHNEVILEKKLKSIMRIDHHPEEDDIDYDYRFVDSSYCSSAEQISHMIQTYDKKPLDKNIAQFLYLGIYTDSGRFFYDYVTSRTHEISAWLFESGFDFFWLHKKLSIRTMDEIKFNQHVLSNIKTYKNIIYHFVKCEDLKKLNISESEANRVDFLANIEGYDIWIFFIENKDKTIRVRFRSSDKDISILAKEYGGGGHKKASGAIINDEKDIEIIVKKAAKL